MGKKGILDLIINGYTTQKSINLTRIRQEIYSFANLRREQGSVTNPTSKKINPSMALFLINLNHWWPLSVNEYAFHYNFYKGKAVSVYDFAFKVQGECAFLWIWKYNSVCMWNQ